MSAHLDPARKHDFAFLFDVRDGNPNGDPDSGGMPRTDPETGQGLVTDVAIKRKIRNVVALLQEGAAGYDIYVESGVALNAQHERAYAALDLDPKQRRKSEAEAQQWMCQTFFDVRMFGAVMSTGTKPCGRVQGPMQLTFSRSISPVLPQEHGITRITQTRQDDIDKGESTEMGNKHAIPYGLYLGYGHFSAPLARRTGVQSQDLEIFWRALTLMFDHDRAASRGEMALRGLYVFSHDDAFGRAPAHQLLERVQAKPNPDVIAPRSFIDYTVSIGNDLPEGVVLAHLVG
ncbi:type I-C CRISPR-associated protein Cas7/Csd2 [Nonomuraea sp. NPDC048916]|uniref:type I-C CRISPR-associated protein Cas7/Csd2 n=1 Tax=Nonomuraea sp. NPDC048916 TaxID=3154232 RepID=UPI0033E2D8B1